MRRKPKSYPKISKQLIEDVTRYVNLRFNHFEKNEIEARVRDTIRALKSASKDKQAQYSRDVENFFEVNAEVLIESFSTAKRQLDNEEVTKLLDIPKDRMKELAMKHGGNINAVLEELRGNDDK